MKRSPDPWLVARARECGFESIACSLCRGAGAAPFIDIRSETGRGVDDACPSCRGTGCEWAVEGRRYLAVRYSDEELREYILQHSPMPRGSDCSRS